MMFDFPVGRYWLNAWCYCLDRHSSFISRVFTETGQTQGIQPSCLCWKKNSACFLVQVFMSPWLFRKLKQILNDARHTKSYTPLRQELLYQFFQCICINVLIAPPDSCRSSESRSGRACPCHCQRSLQPSLRRGLQNLWQLPAGISCC